MSPLAWGNRPRDLITPSHSAESAIQSTLVLLDIEAAHQSDSRFQRWPFHSYETWDAVPGSEMSAAPSALNTNRFTETHCSRVSLRSSSQRMFGILFQFRIALTTSAFVFFFTGAARCTRLRISSGPFCLQANTSPGAAPGSTTRFLLSAVKVTVG